MLKSFLPIVFVKSGGTYVKPRPEWSADHYRHIS